MNHIKMQRVQRVILALSIAGLWNVIRFAAGRRSRFDGSLSPSETALTSQSHRYGNESICPANDSIVFDADKIGVVFQTTGDFYREATSKLEHVIEEQEERIVKPIFEALVALLLFKPPVGIVIMICLLRLFGRGRIFRRYPAPKNSLDIALERRKQAAKQSYTIDQDDVNYHLYGGVFHIRLLLCNAAMASMQDTENEFVRAIMQALSVSTHPNGGRLQLLRDLNHPMSKVEVGMSEYPTLQKESELLTNIRLSLQIHQMDALLRLCRDQVITAAYRLAGAREYWEKRVQSGWRILFGNETIGGDRTRLTFAQASYQGEIQRLGKVVTLLRKRPKDFPLSLLLDAFNKTELRLGTSDGTRIIPSGGEPDTIFAKLGRIYTKLRGFDLSTYSLRWQGDGRGLVSLRSFDNNKLDWQVASQLLNSQTNPLWRDEVSNWVLEARKCISDVVRGARNGSTGASVDEKDFFQFDMHDKWLHRRAARNALDVEYLWSIAIDTVISLSMWRRAGEGKVLTPKDSAIVVGFRRRFDLYGIPSTCIFIWLAYCVHRWAMPRWDGWVSIGSVAVERVARILDRRIRRPFVALYREIMGENKGVTAGFGLKREEVSLDHMLRDLGYGNGRPSTRKIALQRATTAYELALRSGVIRGLVSGRLIRLLLIQVQQLKVGVLSAVGRIDVLLKGNQINFRILAALPALVTLFYIVRFLWRAVYNIRSRDLRPVSVAHQDMATILVKVERLLLMDSGDRVGEITLFLHRYLLLLDFSTPPFPTKLSDEIVASLHALCEIDNRNDQVTLLRRTQDMHNQMANYL